MYELKVARTLAHLWFNERYTGVALPYKTPEQQVITREIFRALLFVEHIKEHVEVKNSFENAGIPMCKVCNKTIDQIYRETP